MEVEMWVPRQWRNRGRMHESVKMDLGDRTGDKEGEETY